MPVINPDTSEQMDMSTIPAGSYPAEITAAEPTTGKEKGTPLIKLTHNVTVDPSKPPREGVLNWVVTQGKGSANFDGLLRAVGLEALADQYKRGEKVPFDTDVLIGQKVKVVIKHEEYNGEMRHRVDRYLKP